MSNMRYVVEITAVVDDVGTTQTMLFGTSGFVTKPTDTPSNTYVSPRLRSAGSLKRELFSGTRVFGATRPAFGELTLFNQDGALDAWADYGVSGGKVILRFGDEDAPYPSGYTEVYTCYAQYVVPDLDYIRVRLRDRLNLLDKPLLTEGFKGTGGLDGDTALSGKLRQWVFGDPYLTPVVTINPAMQLYFVQETSPGGLDNLFSLYEGGIMITRGDDYSTESECLTVSPLSGQCRFYFGPSGSGPVYVRLGSVPKYDLRVSSFGYNPATESPWNISALAARAGITGGTGSVPIGSTLIDDSRTYTQVMEDACVSTFGYFGMTRHDQFVSGVFMAPAGTPVFTFDQYNVHSLVRQPPQDMDAPVYSLTVNSGKRWPSNLADGVGPEMRDRLTREPWWSTFTETRETIRVANPGALAVTVETDARDFQNALAQTVFSDKYFSLFGVRRAVYLLTVPLTSITLGIELHDTVELKYPRYSMAAGKLMRVITQQIDCDKQTITYGVWG